jgi:hypothetical protein
MAPAPVPSFADDEALVSSDADGMTRRTLLRRGAIAHALGPAAGVVPDRAASACAQGVHTGASSSSASA